MFKNPITMMKRLFPLAALFLVACASTDYRYDDDYYYSDDYYGYDSYDPYYGYGSDYSSAGGGVYYNNYNYYPDRWGISYSTVYYSPYRYPRAGFYYSSSRCGWGWYYDCYPGYGFYYNSWPRYGFGWGLGLSYNHYSTHYYNHYGWYNNWRYHSYNPYRYGSRYDSNYPSNRGYYSARNEARRLGERQRSNIYKDQSNNSLRNNSIRQSAPSRRPVNRQRSSGPRYQNSSPRYKDNNRFDSSSPLPNRNRSSSIRGSHSEARRSTYNTNANNQKPAAVNDQRGESAASELIRQRYENNRITDRQQKPAMISTRNSAATNRTNSRSRSTYSNAGSGGINQLSATSSNQRPVNRVTESRSRQETSANHRPVLRSQPDQNRIHNRTYAQPSRSNQTVRTMPVRPPVNTAPRQQTRPVMPRTTKPAPQNYSKPAVAAPKTHSRPSHSQNRSRNRSSSRQRDPN
jgi:hypothetical protein